ncbi:histone PARylation factor 1 isoform X2 [Pantherophis guttatus]|uniref:Histone PARylation factor 1 isoform X2 n=1 Tax=Pantherophis guttatus TaxID=94885 RepID=A0ABM3Z2Y5_PANGU|nr:histone PARylation factor 1 isoform X2 [Pantherophis guttatus]
MTTTGTRMAGGRKRRCHAEAQKQDENIKEVKNVQAGKADVSDCIRQEIESCYRLKMPEDFYHFWKFYALKSSIGLQLVGPYDILSGKHINTNKSKEINFNLHWRFFYDPPEFQTIIVGDSKTQYHMGYFRDIPDQLPVWVGETETQKGCTIYQVGDNIFAAVKLFLSKKLKELTNKKRGGLLKDTDEKLTKTAKQLGYSLEQKSLKVKQRDKKIVTKTFHGAGLVVPVDKNNVGYRELPETNGGALVEGSCLSSPVHVLAIPGGGNTVRVTAARAAGTAAGVANGDVAFWHPRMAWAAIEVPCLCRLLPGEKPNQRLTTDAAGAMMGSLLQPEPSQLGLQHQQWPGTPPGKPSWTLAWLEPGQLRQMLATRGGDSRWVIGGWGTLDKNSTGRRMLPALTSHGFRCLPAAFCGKPVNRTIKAQLQPSLCFTARLALTG